MSIGSTPVVLTDPDVFNLSGRIAIVTGGSGVLGREFVKELHRRGARVAVFDLQSYHFDEGVLFCETDITSKDSLKSSLEKVRQRWNDAPHILINNAGIDSPPHSSAAENGPFEDYPEESWDRVLDVNLKGVFLCSQVVGASMAAAGRGSIVNISSIYGLVSPDQRIYEYRSQEGQPFFKPVAYSASKSGLFNLTRYLAIYWAKAGVRVNTLTLAGVFGNQDPQFLEGYCRRMPLGRMAAPTEYNGALVFLCSNASQYMTGSNLVIDGGWTAW